MKENYPTVNFGKFRQAELNVYNHTINNFNRVFDLTICDYVPNNYGKIFEIRDYHDISEAGTKFLLSLKEELKLFQGDYYDWKTPKDIAERIGEDVELVIKYAKKYYVTNDGIPLGFAKLGEEGYSSNSRTERLSSFQILKDIQMDRRYSQLKKLIK